MEQMQVTAADCGPGDLQDDIGRIDYNWLRHFYCFWYQDPLLEHLSSGYAQTLTVFFPSQQSALMVSVG